ncbi:MAG: uracil-DNA glycosylase, partial [Pseudomonadota bacterium]|nr:uracil-DNA glycosylase [Pseudomonadota bacterium]
ESYLHQQIGNIQPKIIIAMGRFAAQSLLKDTTPISRLRGEIHEYGNFGIPLIATYHPAYLLRSPLEKRKAWADLSLARSSLEKSGEGA